MPPVLLRLGTRGSRLALRQTEWVRDRLGEAGTRAEIVIIETQGDADRERPLHELEGTGFFTKAIEDALLDERIDVAVHSLKDLPTRLPDGLAIAAVPVRHDPREALVGPATLAALPLRARIGTSSLRRSSQIHFLRPDLEVVPLRGNVPTRVDKVHGTQGSPSTLDAALLAVAGLERLGLDRFIAARLDPIDIMPAPGQGALGLEVRADDRAARDSLHVLDHPASAAHVAAERALLAALGGGCQAPVAAYAGTNPDRLFGRVAAADGSVQLTASATLDPRHPAAAGVAVAHLLTAQGAGKLLAR